MITTPTTLNIENMPLVTVGLPVYNGEKYIDIAIASILNQTYKNIELIICDNASTDATWRKILKWQLEDSRIRAYKNEKNIGAIKNTIKIVHLAQGEYYLPASDDDWFSLDYIEKNISPIMHDQNIKVSCGKKIISTNSFGNILSIDDNICGMNDNISNRILELINKTVWTAYYGVTRTEYLKTWLYENNKYLSKFGSDVIFHAHTLINGKIYCSESSFYFRIEHRTAESYEESLTGKPSTTKDINYTPYYGMLCDIFEVIENTDISIEEKEKSKQNIFNIVQNHPWWQIIFRKEFNASHNNENEVIMRVPHIKEFHHSILFPDWWDENKYLEQTPEAVDAIRTGRAASGLQFYISKNK